MVPQRLRLRNFTPCTAPRRAHGCFCRPVPSSSTRCASTKEGGTGVADKAGIDFDKLKSIVKKKPPLYRVLLHNDNLNRREYVVQALMKVVDGMTLEDAVQVMQEAHMNNVALVIVTAQEAAEEYVTGLRRNGLTSTLEPTGSGGSESDQ